MQITFVFLRRHTNSAGKFRKSVLFHAIKAYEMAARLHLF
jgi:hypothetical protein